MYSGRAATSTWFSAPHGASTDPLAAQRRSAENAIQRRRPKLLRKPALLRADRSRIDITIGCGAGWQIAL
jgi:hypothetical protein